jgi:hypothetical protein
MLARRMTPDWDMQFGQGLANYAANAEAVAQRVKARLQLLRGEWFLDTDAGVPYLTEIVGRPADLPRAAALLKQAILDTEGVAELSAFDLALNRETRKLTVTATAATIYGDNTTIKVSLA